MTHQLLPTSSATQLSLPPASALPSPPTIQISTPFPASVSLPSACISSILAAPHRLLAFGPAPLLCSPAALPLPGSELSSSTAPARPMYIPVRPASCFCPAATSQPSQPGSALPCTPAACPLPPCPQCPLNPFQFSASIRLLGSSAACHPDLWYPCCYAALLRSEESQQRGTEEADARGAQEAECWREGQQEIKGRNEQC
mmetsp:Transcript_38623/g.60253  ORF Transcript_38623/g.60253 Transcript_38623/m.60253 type:complete len:200 (-) Transcript_38623:164-763(-)